MSLFSKFARCSSRVPSAGVQQFPDDVLIEVLCRLPVESLMRYKCVCKSWHNLISAVCVPRFLSSLPPLSGFLCRALYKGCESSRRGEITMQYVPYCNPNEAYTEPSVLREGGAAAGGFVDSFSSLLPFKHSLDDLLDICSGLLLFVNRQSTSAPQYYVCNPTTKQCVCIPKATFHMEDCFASLAFDPCESSHYKVARFPSPPKESVPIHQLLDIFSSENGRWVRHQIPVGPSDLVDDERLVIRRSCYLHGVLYRLALSKRLLCFNLMKMTRQAIALPEISWDNNDAHGFIGVSSGLLHYVNKDRHRIKVWVLDCGDGADYNWILKYNILHHDVTRYCLDDDDKLVRTSYRTSFSDLYKLYAIHPTSDIIYMGSSRTIFTLHLDSSSLKVYFQMLRNRKKEVVLGQVYVFCYSTCYVVLNEFPETNDC